jgi:hypothetical protein
LPSSEEIEEMAIQLDIDAKTLHEAALALERRSAPARLVSDIRKRRDEWEDQADEMRRRSVDLAKRTT